MLYVLGSERNMNNDMNNNMNNMNNNEFNNQNMNQGMNNMPNNNQFNSNVFADATTKNKEKLCEIGFWISIFGLLIAFKGIAFGVFVYIAEYYFAAQGLNTKKRWKALATIGLATFSIVIIIIQIIKAAK